MSSDLIDKYIAFYTMEEAVQAVIDWYYSKAREYTHFIGSATNQYLDKVIKEKFFRQYIGVDVVSPNRIAFEDADEVKSYYLENILNVSAEERYEFLLSLLVADEREYDCNGNFLRRMRNEQHGDWNRLMIPSFSMETAKDLKYEV